MFFLYTIYVAVGRTIKIKDKDQIPKSYVIKERPRQCAFCPCKSGLHAMHPLYDKHQKDGQPLMKDGKPIFVHTLCALFICSYDLSRGLVYGCNAIGDYDDGSTSTQEVDKATGIKRKRNKFDRYFPFRYFHLNEEVLTASPHHFVMASISNGDGPETIQMLKDIKDLKCFLCKNTDKHNRRINIQCMDPKCVVACHVGCAKWSTDHKLLRFFPGNSTEDECMEFYCRKHTKFNPKDSPIKKNKKSSTKNNINQVATNHDAPVYNVNDDESVIFDDDSQNEDEPKKKDPSQTLSEQKSPNEGLDLKDKKSNNSKYFKKKEMMEEILESMLVQWRNNFKPGDDLIAKKKQVIKYWQDHGNIKGKKDFANLVKKFEQKIAASEKQVLAVENQRKHSSSLKRQRSGKGYQNSPKKMKNPWKTLFVPEYVEGSFKMLYDDRFCKKITISESEMQDEDESLMSF